MSGVVALGDESSISCGIDPDINGGRLLPQAYLHLCCPLATSGWQPKQLWSYDLYLRIGCVFLADMPKIYSEHWWRRFQFVTPQITNDTF